MRAGVLPLHSMTARFNTRSGSQQAEREECKSCALGEMFGPGEAETPEHYIQITNYKLQITNYKLQITNWPQ